MSSAGPAELSAAVVIQRIESGLFPRDVILNVARGFLPLSQEDLIAVLSYLTTKDAEVADLARASLAEIPARSILAFVSSTEMPSVTAVMWMYAQTRSFSNSGCLSRSRRRLTTAGSSATSPRS